MRRRIIQILVILFILMSVATIATHVILTTDLPQQLVIETLNKELGMKVTADSLRTSWGGKTIIKDLTLSLPMEDSPLMVIPEIDISHTPLPLILFHRSVTLDSVQIVYPTINIRQDETGQWNIQKFVYHIQQVAAGWKKQKKLRLPQLDIVDGQLVVHDSNGYIEKVSPISFQGKIQSKPVWNFQANIASQITATGSIAEGGNWSHEFNLNVTDLPNFIKNLISVIPETFKLNTRWKGRIRGNELVGRLELEEVRFGGLQTNGTLDVETSLSNLMIHFEDFLVNGPDSPLENIRFFGGSLQFDGNKLQADSILVDAGDSRASITGSWNRSEKEGIFNGFWTGTIAEQDIDYENTFNGTIKWPEIGNKQINLSITSQGQLPSGNWHSQGSIVGSGDTWLNSQWNITIARLALQLRENDIISRDIKAEISVEWPNVKLVNLSSANTGQSKAEGEFSADTQNWAISVQAEGLKANERQSSSFDIRLTAGGNRKNISVSELKMAYNDLKLEAAGNIALPSSELYDTHASASWIVQPSHAAKEGFTDVSGNLQCETVVMGNIWPVSLQLKSVLSGKDITLNKKVIQELNIPWQAEIDTKKVQYNTDKFQLLDGIWNLNGEHDLSQHTTHLALNADQVSLQTVIESFGIPLDCRGLMTASLEANLPGYDINQATISGSWSVKEMAIAPIEADHAEGQIRIQNGTASFDQIRLKKNDGQILAGARFRINQPQLVSLEIEAQQWPLYFPNNNSTFVTNARGNASLNLAEQTMRGKGYLLTSVTMDDNKLADISAEIAVEERKLNVNNIRIEALNGLAEGMAVVPLDNWLDSSTTIQWQDINIGTLAPYLSELEGLRGISSGSLTMAQAEDRRAFEPLRLEIRGQLSEGAFKSAKIGEYQISAYLGKKRLLIDQLELKALDGTIKSSASLSRHVGGFSTYINADFSQVELNQLLHLLLPQAKPVLGRLTGKGMLVVYSDLHGMTGEAYVQISESDLARTIVVSTLYDTMNLKLGSHQPTGQGQIKLRFEGSSLEIPSFVYFNRGVEIRGGGTIDNLAQGKTSSVKGYAVGTARPLKGISLPGMEDLDRLITSLQTNVSSVKIQGTLAEPEVIVVPYQEISSGLRALLWSQLQK